ncbi:D-alanyl-D-alanine carboxypeptidase family protein [Paenibacillus flagellatus]|uniref:serine-type D-Ala-D-Ala carboxypeptidase n=1 Tax=Paenibacillus flagellatus TaxID=2211139 RepID=A0A2V5JWW6_9BACL|nr:D-alanyl-D-alanine carboxypeptidase family protein [Paenibacillus flagellatus]PYI51101.1 D-alanyl-D-alanine carboxypeptidase [Paenibacillus flagellatus]
MFIQPPPKTEAAEATDLKLEVKAAILIEASTGQVLYEMNADEPLPPASMSKMMTEYLVMESIKSGKHKWEDIVSPSQYAVDVIGSGQLIGPGEKYSVKDLFGAMSIYSANDATVALAEFVGDTEEKFVGMMNDTAKKLGFNPKSFFINATGLSRSDLGKYAPASITQNDTMITARDASILAYHILKEHPEVLEFAKIPSKKFREKDKDPMINWNWMLEGNKDNPNFKQYVYPGMDGLKTGHTDEAGYCFTGTAVRNGMRLISVVMAAPSMAKRFVETQKLLDYGFNNFEMKSVIGAKSEIDSMKEIPVKKGVKTTVPVVTADAVDFVVKKGENPQVEIQAAPLDTIKSAPIKTGDVLGTVKVKYNNIEKQVNLVASQDMEKGSWFRLLMRGIKNFFGGIFSGIANGLKNLF